MYYANYFLALCWNGFAIFTVTDKLQQHSSIKFYEVLSKSATKTLEIFRRAFVRQALGRTQVFECHVYSISDRVLVPVYERAEGLKAPENVRKSRKLVHEERLRTIHLLSHMNRISYGV